MTWPGAREQVDPKLLLMNVTRAEDGYSSVRAQRRTGQALALEAKATQAQMSALLLKLGSACFQK